MPKGKSNGGANHWVGVDLGGTKIAAAVLDANLKVVAEDRIKTKGHQGQADGLGRLGDLIAQTLALAGLDAGQVGAIGIGSPGPLDLERGVILDTPNLGWRNAPLKQTLTERFARPVHVLNDVDAGAYGEYALGAGQQARCVGAIFPGTGIGAGLVYEGRLIRGRTLSCLEIGHIPVLPAGPLCGCGRRGCLESVASRLAIATQAAAAALRGEAPYLFEKTQAQVGKIRSRMLAQSIAAGDQAVETIVRQAAAWLGVGCATLINLLAPDTIVLGGGLVEALPKLYLEEVTRATAAHVMPPFAGSYRIVIAQLGDHAGLLGAAAFARDQQHATPPTP